MAASKPTELSPTSTAVEEGTVHHAEKPSKRQQQQPWYSRKRNIAGIAFAVVAVIVIAVTVPVVVVRNKNRGYATGVNGAFQSRRPAGPYSEVVMFGDGFADNGRPREEVYASSRAPNAYAPADLDVPYWQNRWTRGPTMPEFLHGLLQTNQSGNGSAPADASFSNIEAKNYAYGWATVLTFDGMAPNGTMPLRDQVARYLADVEGNSTAADPSRRCLVPIQMGAMDVYVIWETYLDTMSPVVPTRDSALDLVRQAADEVVSAMSQLLPTDASPKPTPDYVILPLHPLEKSPRAGRIAEMYGSDTSFLKDLTVEFNKRLMDSARRFSEQSNVAGNVFSVDAYDWLASQNDPFRTDNCYRNRACWGTWWSDPMHLMYSKGYQLAERAAEVILGYPVSVDRSRGFSQYYTWQDGQYD